MIENGVLTKEIVTFSKSRDRFNTQDYVDKNSSSNNATRNLVYDSSEMLLKE